MNKPFSKELYNTHNMPAIQAVRAYLDLHEYYTCSYEDYGADIKSLRPLYHEVEIKLGWTGQWPGAWATVHISKRKDKLIAGGHDVVFWILSANKKQACVIKGCYLREEYLREISNKEVEKGEYFYDIPIGLCSFIEL